MNTLVDRFPTTAEIDGVEYELNTDFRVGVQIMLAFEDTGLTSIDKQLVMLHLLYKEIPPDLHKACELAVLFLNCGESPEGEANDTRGGRLYSFGKDAKYIYSAIRQTHGIDLEETGYLHWWKFCYLFLDLREDCFFQQMLYLRRRKQDGKLTKEERMTYYRMEDILSLPEEKDAEQRAAENAFVAQITSSSDGRS
ncbi:bacteriophage Gp15 family protein [Intestinibacillus massiliensis]|uniref:bacteriophage Gp15 family protein n=1 Tax=Intestinibacillus massiliensis TaxID=1871029 RepID=UPI000B35C11D|nr:bacteriophage Gp15 family protein [Intestinibacillus massiliensis]